MPTKDKTKLFKDVTCPFCSLLCDDLVIKNHAGKISVVRKGCHKAIKLFEHKEPHVTPMIHGEKVSLTEALEHAAAILREAKQPLFAGSSTDIAGSRELMALAEISGATLDHAYGDAMTNNIRVLQNKGWIMTTLAELKNRADMIIFVGTDAVSQYPRFFERFVWNQSSLAGLKKNSRDIVYIGDELDTKAGRSPEGKKPVQIHCGKKELNESLGIIRALLSGSNIQADNITTRYLNSLEKITQRMQEARYGVIVWDAAEFSAVDGELTIQIICDLIKDLNKQQRFAGLSLGGNDGGNSFMNVCSWQSGFPLRVSYRQGYPEHDPYSFSTKRILKDKTADALLWLSSFDTSLLMPGAEIPTIVLSRPSLRASKNVEVFIPVGTPGIDHMGNLMRTDNVVTLPLTCLRDRQLPEASKVLEKIRQTI